MTVWLTPDDVAERIGVARRTAMEMMWDMPHSIISGTVRKRIRVSEDALDAWMAKRSTGTVVTASKGTKKKLQRR